MATWLEDTIQALENLGGVAWVGDIYNEVKRMRQESLPLTPDDTIRNAIYTHSSDSSAYKGGPDIFYSKGGLGTGVWGLRSLLLSTPQASDIAEPPNPARSKSEIYRILRDTLISRNLKQLYKNQCQICGTTLELGDGSKYSETHHIRPLGTPYNGPDIAANIIVLCPNHHVLCDYGAIPLRLEDLKIHPDHKVGAEYLLYFNNEIFNHNFKK